MNRNPSPASHPLRPTPPSPLPTPSPLRFNRKRIIILVILGLLTVVLLLALGGGREAIGTLAAAYWPLVALAVLIHYSGFAMRGLRWQQLLDVMGHRLPYRYVTTLLLSGWFISALLPARAGDVARVTLLRSPRMHRSTGYRTPTTAGVPIADSLSSILLERVLDLLAILILGAGFGFVVLRGQLPTWVLVAYGTGVALLAFLGLMLLLIPTLIGRLRRVSPHGLWQKLLDFVEQLVTSLRTLPRHPRVALFVIAESVYIWLCDALLLWLVVWSLGTQLPFGATAFTALTVDVFAAVPLTPGGIGQIEAVYAALLALFVLPALHISAAILLTRAISYWSFLIVSGIVTFVAGVGQILTQDEVIASTGYGAASPSLADLDTLA